MFYRVFDYFQFYITRGRFLLKVLRSVKAKSRFYLIVRRKIYMLYIYIFFVLINVTTVTEEYFIGIGLLCLLLYTVLYLDRMTGDFFVKIRFMFFKTYYDLICKGYRSGLFYLRYIESEIATWSLINYMDTEIEEMLHYFFFEMHDIVETVFFFYENKVLNIFNYLFELFFNRVDSYLLIIEKIYFLTKLGDMFINKKFDLSFIKLKKIKFFSA